MNTDRFVTVNATGIVPASFVSHALAAYGGQLGGRFDSGNFRLTGTRNDAAEAAFTQRALTFIDTFMYSTLVPPLEARKFIPTSVKVPAGNRSYLYRRTTRTGVARLITGTSLDVPRAAMYVDEINQQVYDIGVKIVYSYFELLAVGAALANGQPVDLVGESLRGALEAIEKKLDYIAAFGTAASPNANDTVDVEADVGLVGLLNNPSATQYTIPVGAAGSTTWASKTPDEVLADLNGIVGSQVSSTFKVHRPDTIIVPILQMEQQLNRRMSDVSDTTIGEFFIKTQAALGHPVEIVSWMYNAGAGTAGADLMVAYKRDPRMFEHILAVDATPLAPSTVDLATTQVVYASTAGVVMRYPLSVSLASGI